MTTMMMMMIMKILLLSVVLTTVLLSLVTAVDGDNIRFGAVIAEENTICSVSQFFSTFFFARKQKKKLFYHKTRKKNKKFLIEKKKKKKKKGKLHTKKIRKKYVIKIRKLLVEPCRQYPTSILCQKYLRKKNIDSFRVSFFFLHIHYNYCYFFLAFCSFFIPPQTKKKKKGIFY